MNQPSSQWVRDRVAHRDATRLKKRQIRYKKKKCRLELIFREFGERPYIIIFYYFILFYECKLLLLYGERMYIIIFYYFILFYECKLLLLYIRQSGKLLRSSKLFFLCVASIWVNLRFTFSLTASQTDALTHLNHLPSCHDIRILW